MNPLEIVLAIAFGVQFLASVSLAIKVRQHEIKLEMTRDVINEIGMYLANEMMNRRKNNAKSKSKVS
jgi:hypothetical protein